MEKTSFRFPTKEEFEKLLKLNNGWDNDKKGLLFKEGNNELFLAANGINYCSMTYRKGIVGNYWAASNNENISYIVSFSEDMIEMHYSSRFFGYSIRLVSDTPFEGAIKMIGLYWKPENEEDYFTYDDANSLFK